MAGARLSVQETTILSIRHMVMTGANSDSRIRKEGEKFSKLHGRLKSTRSGFNDRTQKSWLSL
ncbi:hypothetical protein PFISCL1PPCAC_17650 [Pristionchus fissidentatus]|uniref:Uncharacterized protein n=1 Tax=Pristionchus fissidentatus TaxID=1538716 RepID=A0AAV5W7B8_9BILA|nr:hypothetical protein PFISCL1PPCAC_17650 [Pristionchus fissidentatus]